MSEQRLDQKVFLQGINYLKANYLKWEFDINNDLMIKVWYKKFSHLDAKVFMGLVEKYTELNKFPPQSPAELLELLREEITKKELSPNEAWQEVIRLISKYGIQYRRSDFYNDLESQNRPALLKTVREFERELSGLMSNDNYTPERFKQAYSINLRRQVEKSSAVLLGMQNILYIE